jgi:hypothetical protein
MDLPTLVDNGLTLALVMAPITLALTEGIKRSGLPDHYAFPVSMAVGLTLVAGFSLLLAPALTRQAVAVALMGGLLSGLAASGLYSGVRSLR